MPCLVVGAGRVGAGKAEVLVAAGARVLMVATGIGDHAAEPARAGRSEVNARLPRISDRRAFRDRVFEGPIAEMAFAREASPMPARR